MQTRRSLLRLAALSLLWGWSGLAILPGPAVAQEAEKAVSLTADWKVGDRFRLEVVKGKERWEGDVKSGGGKSTTVIDVEVVGDDGPGYLMNWVFGATTIPEDAPDEDAELARRLAAMNEGLVVEVRTDEFGSYASVENPVEVRRHVRRAMGEILEAMRAKGASEEEVGALEQALAPMLQGPHFVDAAAQYAGLYLAASGLALDLGESIDYEAELPNPFGGPAFPATGSWTLEDHDPEEGRATVRWRQVLEPVRAREIMLETFTVLAGRMGRPAPKPEELPAMDIRDDSSFVYDLERSLPERVRWLRTVVVGEGKQVEWREFSWKPALPK